MSGNRVVVVGGGYAGIVVARELDDVADVTLVEPRSEFVHATAALRAAVDVAWEPNVFLSYDHLLTNGRVVHDRARRITPRSVHLTSTDVLEADHVVIATGTSYPFPAKFIESEGWVARARLGRLREALATSSHALLVGAGPVGLELAGELHHAYPDMKITIVEQAERILPSPELMEPLRESLRTQLEDAGVRFVLGARLGYLPPVDVGIHQPFVVETTTGEKIEADIWFRAYGNRAESDALDGTLAAVRRGDGSIRVDGHLRVAGHGTVWAVGDVTDVKESKRAQHAIAHARVVAANLRSVLAGEEPTVLYRPEPEIVVIPLGPEGGASQVMKRDGSRTVLDAHETSRIKGQDLMVGPLKELLGIE